MTWHDRPPWANKRAEQTARMDEIAKVVRRFQEGDISAHTAIEKIRELIEPPVVRVGQGHTPEVQS